MTPITDDERIEELRRLSSGDGVVDEIGGPAAAAGTAIGKAAFNSTPDEELTPPAPEQGFDYDQGLIDAGQDAEMPAVPQVEEATLNDKTAGVSVEPLDSETVEAPASSNSAASSKAPATQAAPKPQGDSERDETLEALRGLTSYKPPEALDDSAIAAAQAKDRGNRDFNRLSSLIAAATQRRALGPGDFESGPSEADDLLKRRQLDESSTGRANNWRIAVANALKQKADKPRDALKDRLTEAQIKNTEGQIADRAAKLGKFEGQDESVEKMVLEWLGTPAGKKSGLKPEQVSGLQREDAYKLMEKYNVTGKGGGTGGPRKSGKAGDIESVPGHLRETIRAIGEGRLEAPKAGSRFGAEILQYVAEVYPSFDGTAFGAYKGVKDKLTKSDSLQAVSVAKHHLQQAYDLIPANVDIPLINKAIKAVVEKGGSDQFSGFTATIAAAAAEVAKAYGADDAHSRAVVLEQFNSIQSPAQLRTVIKAFQGLLEGKQRGQQSQYDRVAPKGIKMDFIGAGDDHGAGHGSPAGAPPPAAGKKTPGGKDYASKKFSAKTQKTYFVGADGKTVVEVVDGQH